VTFLKSTSIHIPVNDRCPYYCYVEFRHVYLVLVVNLTFWVVHWTYTWRLHLVVDGDSIENSLGSLFLVSFCVFSMSWGTQTKSKHTLPHTKSCGMILYTPTQSQNPKSLSLSMVSDTCDTYPNLESRLAYLLPIISHSFIYFLRPHNRHVLG
jgi:hypothetical protein